MLTPSTGSRIGILALIGSASAIAAHFQERLWPVLLFKPLATILIFTIAFTSWRVHKSAYALAISIGLAFSLLGDVLLIWPAQYFVAGLAAFLLTHVCYFYAFKRDVRFPARWWVWLVYLAMAAGLYLVLNPHLPMSLKLPVAVYAIALATMASQAMGRAILLSKSEASLAAIGALLFMLSDTLLALHRFHSPLPYSPLLILTPYFLAQFCIAWSTRTPPAVN